MSSRLDAVLFDDEARGVDRFGLLLLATVATIVTLSLADLASEDELRADVGSALVTIFTGITFILTTRAAGVARRWRRAGDVLVAASALAAVALIIADAPGDGGGAAPSPIWVALVFLMPLAVVRRILKHAQVTLATLIGALSAYLLLAVTFTYTFLTVDEYQSESFFGEEQPTTSFMYFSLTSLTTLGYGDLAPATALGRLLSVSEAVVGQIFLVTLVAALVGLYAQRGRDRRRMP